MKTATDSLITDLLALSIVTVKTKSIKKRQLAKMTAGKIKKQLSELNKDTSIKINN